MYIPFWSLVIGGIVFNICIGVVLFGEESDRHKRAMMFGEAPTKEE